MKAFLSAFFLLLFSCCAFTQVPNVDTLRQIANNQREDTSKVLALSTLADYYGFNQFDSSIFYAQKTIDLARKINYPYGSFLGLRGLFFAYNCQGNYSRALEVTLQNFKITEKIKDERPFPWAIVHYLLGVLNREMENFPVAISQFQQAIQISEKAEGPNGDVFPEYAQMALAYQKSKQPDSAMWCAKKAYDLSLASVRFKKYSSLASLVLGSMYLQLHQLELAKKYFYTGIEQSKTYNNSYFLARSYYSLANLLKEEGQIDSCAYYARISLQICGQHNFIEYALDASSVLTKVFESQNQPDSAYKYMRVMVTAKDSIFSPAKMQTFQKFFFNEEQRKQQIQKEQDQYRNKIKTFALLAGIFILILIAFILWRNNKRKQIANSKIEKAYKELKSTQAQLIQSEKMASLGELTAGIAHEIQNPLNFVNNFSEVNKELLEELKDEADKGNIDEIKAIANDVIVNQEKINHHGKRADAIVKGMLQHSRAGTGHKELTDINALANEHLRLSYHAFRAKDKSFDAVPVTIGMQTDFDESIGKINIIPQDIGRVLLNLYNNAFYAVDEKRKQQAEDYEPTITVTTKKINDIVELTVKDNGNGIPQKVIDKIFQPFFTTKPTGQGTGLGLSLSYDIVKAHRGEIKVTTKENEGTEFIIQLPKL